MIVEIVGWCLLASGLITIGCMNNDDRDEEVWVKILRALPALLVASFGLYLVWKFP